MVSKITSLGYNDIHEHGITQPAYSLLSLNHLVLYNCILECNRPVHVYSIVETAHYNYRCYYYTGSCLFCYRSVKIGLSRFLVMIKLAICPVGITPIIGRTSSSTNV